ncbi:DUF2238 domain-containing protein [Marinihelvus fidelis]|uniref:DUF2238 domain-containing protein n=1 Tax=Marinihelvus fidelis TaxID=2613842 RepID=A0A5N0THB9_9GAMM|nr:DUF2238 domain-containing protein [Marinihelvus fidelis]KAA9132689.1 DUF2238 domain-containing protein [Marinihelvus fidelis]
MTTTRTLEGFYGIIAFTAAYLLAATAWVIHVGDLEFLAYIAIMLVLAGVVWLVHRRVGLPRALVACLSIWGALHMAGGLVLLPDGWDVGEKSNVLYNWHIAGPNFKYDQLVHAFGFGTTTWMCWRGLLSMAPDIKRPPSAGALLICAAAGMGFGALNEVIEFIITVLVPENNVGGYVNTAMDLVYNTIGAATAALLIRWANRASLGSD